MSKRQTGASPKTAVTEKGKRTPSKGREFRSRAEREAELQRYIMLAVIVAVAATAVLLIGALVFQQFILPNLQVALVNGRPITVAQFQERVRFERVLHIERLNNVISQYMAFGLDPNQLIQQEPYSTWWNELRLPEQMGNRVVNDMVNDLLVRDAAASLGITVTEEQIQTAIDEFFGYTPPLPVINGQQITPTPSPTLTPSPTPLVSPTASFTPTTSPTPTATATATGTSTLDPTWTPTVEPTLTFTPVATLPPTGTPSDNERIDNFNSVLTNFYDLILAETGMDYADIRYYFESLALRDAVAEAVSGIGETALYANIRHILVATQEEATDVIAALNAGEPFADLARAVSTDTGSGQNGGELGWAPIQQYVTSYVDPFAQAARDAAIGAIVGPVQSEFGFHIIQVLAREERPLDEFTLQGARDRAFDAWLQTQRTTAGITVETYPNIWASYVPEDPPFVLR
jgi:parvulin-like peptidyl-prolyl isomerase